MPLPFSFPFTDASLRGNGQYGVTQLGEHHADDIEFIYCFAASDSIGDCRNGGGQLTRIHKNHL